MMLTTGHRSSRLAHERDREYRIHDIPLLPISAWQHRLGPAPPLDVNKEVLDANHRRPESPTTATNTSVYYTTVSVGDQIEYTFENHRRPSHPDVAGRVDVYPYHGALLDVEQQNPWDGSRKEAKSTVLLRNVEPRSSEDEFWTG
jgi:hypothetical protein